MATTVTALGLCNHCRPDFSVYFPLRHPLLRWRILIPCSIIDVSV